MGSIQGYFTYAVGPPLPFGPTHPPRNPSIMVGRTTPRRRIFVSGPEPCVAGADIRGDGTSEAAR